MKGKKVTLHFHTLHTYIRIGLAIRLDSLTTAIRLYFDRYRLCVQREIPKNIKKLTKFLGYIYQLSWVKAEIHNHPNGALIITILSQAPIQSAEDSFIKLFDCT